MRICVLAVTSIFLSFACNICLGEAQLLGFDKPHRINGTYVVTLKEDPARFRATKTRLAKARKGTAPGGSALIGDLEFDKRELTRAGALLAAAVRGRVSGMLPLSKSIVIDASEEEIRRLRHEPDVESIEVDQPAVVTGTQSPAPYGLTRIDQRERPIDDKYVYNSRGHPYDVWVMDTGVWGEHPDISAWHDPGAGYPLQIVSRGYASWFVTSPAPAGGYSEEGEDCAGHGSHIAGIIQAKTFGVSKFKTTYTTAGYTREGVWLHMIVGANCAGVTSVARMRSAIQTVASYAAINNRIQILNLSMSATSAGTDSLLVSDIQNAIALGVVIVAGAGPNEAVDACNYLPGGAPGVITVGALTDTDYLWQDTGYGSCVELFAPGDNINSLKGAYYDSSGTLIKKRFPSCSTASGVDVQQCDGVSMATAFVTGSIALLAAEFEDGGHAFNSVEEVRAALIAATTKDEIKGNLKGSPNRILYSRGGVDLYGSPPVPEVGPDIHIRRLMPAILMLLLEPAPSL